MSFQLRAFQTIENV